jgi:hypothetical protein
VAPGFSLAIADSGHTRACFRATAPGNPWQMQPR